MNNNGVTSKYGRAAGLRVEIMGRQAYLKK
jgi:hypothetical protein